MSLEGTFTAMAYNNAWSNHRFLTACAALSDAELNAERVGFFPSIRLTLNHILEVDRFYIDALENGGLGQDAYALPIPASFDAFRQEQFHWDQRLIALCRDMTDSDLFTEVRLERSDGIHIDRMDRTLLHVFQHQIHHRGQAHAMLAGTSVAPPQLDEFFLLQDESLRADDLAVLEWTESDVWRS